MQSSDRQVSRPPLGSIVWGIALNAVFPVVLYKLSKRYLSATELTALVIATAFPLGKSIFDLVRRGQVDPISIVVLLGIVTDGVALLFGGGARVAGARIVIHRSVRPGLLCHFAAAPAYDVLFWPLFHSGHQSREAEAL